MIKPDQEFFFFNANYSRSTAVEKGMSFLVRT